MVVNDAFFGEINRVFFMGKCILAKNLVGESLSFSMSVYKELVLCIVYCPVYRIDCIV